MDLKQRLNKIIPNYKPTKMLDLENLSDLYAKLTKYLIQLKLEDFNKLQNEIDESFSMNENTRKKYNILEEIVSRYLRIAKPKTAKPKTAKKTAKKKKLKIIKPIKKNGELSCLGKYQVINVLGEGAFGKVYLVKKGIKKYALKEQVLDIGNDFDMDIRADEIINEIEISKLMGKEGIGPKIYDSYMCKTKNKLKI